VSAFGQDIASLYFRYKSAAGHMPKCALAGTDTWETTRFTWSSFDGSKTQTTLRLACGECGAVTFLRFDEEESFEATHASQVGFGTRPERVAGLWLHPGPLIWRHDDRGPTSFYVTRTKDRPRDPADVAGVVGWHLGKRGGVRWSAGTGCTAYGSIEVGAGQDFASRRAAVAWIAAALTADERAA
jgi:hypothetical protein